MDLEDNRREITRRTFLKHTDRQNREELERNLGYVGIGEKGLHITSDWHVRYYKGKYRGRLVYEILWSQIDHIFA